MSIIDFTVDFAVADTEYNLNSGFEHCPIGVQSPNLGRGDCVTGPHWIQSEDERFPSANKQFAHTRESSDFENTLCLARLVGIGRERRSKLACRFPRSVRG